MNLFVRKVRTPDGVRTMHVATADSDPRALWKSSAVTILRGDADASSVRALLDEGLAEKVDREKLFLVFPDPLGGAWNSRLDPDGPRDAEWIAAIQDSLNSGRLTAGWRAINDVHYLLGIGSGADMVHTLAAAFPTGALAAAVCTVGGAVTDEALARATYSPVPAYLVSPDPRTTEYYIRANAAKPSGEPGQFACPHHPLQKVRVEDGGRFTRAVCDVMWETFFRRIRRTNTSPTGDVDRRIVPEECGFNWHIADTRLGDNGGMGHDWLEHVPAQVLVHPERKVPLMVFGHGATDNPLKAADMAKFHEIGEREGFVTVYPASSDRVRWNLSRTTAEADDVAYYDALIDYLVRTYPIDTTRIYLSGFSNGAGMAMTYAMARPERIAAICPVDSTFPYASMRFFRPGGSGEPFMTEIPEPGEAPPAPLFKPSSDPEANLAPMRAALASQAGRPLRMPVMYFYGSRESEYPIRAGSNQQIQYEFWKRFNRMPVGETVDALEPEAVGVVGDERHELRPSAEHPGHVFGHHVFRAPDDGGDYYNFVLMHGKAHDVHPAERELGWGFVSRFSRNPDGTLNDAAGSPSGARPADRRG